MGQRIAAAALAAVIGATIALTYHAGRLDGIRHTLEDSRIGCTLTGDPEDWIDTQQIFLCLDGREFLLGGLTEYRIDTERSE